MQIASEPDFSLEIREHLIEQISPPLGDVLEHVQVVLDRLEPTVDR